MQSEHAVVTLVYAVVTLVYAVATLVCAGRRVYKILPGFLQTKLIGGHEQHNQFWQCEKTTRRWSRITWLDGILQIGSGASESCATSTPPKGTFQLEQQLLEARKVLQATEVKQPA